MDNIDEADEAGQTGAPDEADETGQTGAPDEADETGRTGDSGGADEAEGLTYAETGVDIEASGAATAALVGAVGEFEGDYAGLVE